jgi:serine/threonine-protein kinase
MTPDSENWEQLQTLFHLAEKTPQDELEELLLKSCEDAELRQRVLALIKASRQEPPPTRPAGIAPEETRIGPYVILRHLGSGGIGTVYLVERTVGGAVQRTALKMIARSAAGPAFLDRFAREQHILASLDHPNITRLLDAGVSEAGRPYLVMEFVDGVHLDTYCDDHKLGVEERLRLYLNVCEAVAYAHRNLVVHLDLKPSNILVTQAEGNVKLLDFGTSKLIQPDSLLTTTIMATPAYASPEQLRHEPVTTASDIYALGAILFDLLSGRRPNQDLSVASMIERSMKEFPAEPLTGAITRDAADRRGLTETRLRNTLSGDLSTIVARCLNPRAKDRYTSVDALIVDVQRYMAGRPILARPQTTGYKISKFVRRNRKMVAVSVVAGVAVIATLGYAAWRQQQEVRAARRALQMQGLLRTIFTLANPEYTGKPVATVPEFLQLGVRLLPEFVSDPADLRAEKLSLAESMFDSGDLKDALPVFQQVGSNARAARDLPIEAEAESYAGSIDYNDGKLAEGKALSEHALSLIHAAGVTPSSRINIQIQYALASENAGFRTDQNLQLLEDAVSESRKAKVPDHERAYALISLSEKLNPRGRLDEAEAALQEAIGIYESEPYALCEQSRALENMALFHNQRRDFQGSVRYMQQSYKGFAACSGEGSKITLEAQSYLAAAMLGAGQYAQVVPMLEVALPRWRSLVGSDSGEMATPLLFLTRAYLLAKDFPHAEGTARELLRVQQGKVNPLSAQMGICNLVMAQALDGQTRYREALPYAEAAETAFTAEGSKAAGTQRNAAKAKDLLQKLRDKMDHGARLSTDPGTK